VRGTARLRRWVRHLEPDSRRAAGLLRGAEEDLRASVTSDPSRASAWNSLAGVYYQKPDLVEATLATRRAYEEDAYLSDAADILWRLYATAYDNEQFVDAVHWCDEGRRRFPASPQFVQCQLWLFTTSGRAPDAAAGWRLVEELKQRTPPRQWPYAGREAQMLVAAALGRAGQLDSARHVLEHARADANVDPERELVATEAFIRTLLGDRDEAIRLIKVYLTTHPEHRAGLAASQSWWWRELRGDPRFKALVGTGD
jgi:eukaryotic-like serine/threonine-protein kinase